MEVFKAMKEQVQQIINDKINPVLALHKGSCELVDVNSFNDITIRLRGGCVGCPSSKITLYNGIIPILRENLPELNDVYLEE